MKYLLFVIPLMIFASCDKDGPITPEDEEEPYVIKDFIVVGDFVSNNVQFVSYYPAITLQDSHNSLEIHEIDIDSDGINDFQLNLYSYLPYAGTWYQGTSIRIKSLHPTAEISKAPLYEDSTYFYPHQYMENDSLLQESLWASDEFLVSSNNDDPSDSCFSPGCPMTSHGTWFGLNDQYIGVRTCGASLGWIKISLPVTDPNVMQIIVIEEFACVP